MAIIEKSSWSRKFIGFLMRWYRKSPLYPWAGKSLAHLLAAFMPQSTTNSLATIELKGAVFELDLREVIDSSLYFSGSFEPLAEEIIANSLSAGMVAIDVGANIGYHTLAMAQHVGSLGLVVAIEPTNYAFNKLERNLSLNNFHNVRLLRVGLSDKDYGETEVCFRSSYRLDGKDEIRNEIVRIMTINTLVLEQGLTKIDFMKIDVDGFEGKIFAGAQELLKRFRPILFFEFSPSGIMSNGGNPEEILNMLWDLGYDLQTDTGEKLPRVVSAVYRTVLPGTGLINLLAIPKKTT